MESVTDNIPKLDIAFLLANSEDQIEKYAAMYKNLQPKEESLTFIPPNFELLQDIRNQGEIVINCRSNFMQNTNSNGSTTPSSSASALIQRQPARIAANSNNSDKVLWDSVNESGTSATSTSNNPPQATAMKTYASIVKPAVISGQCIPGSNIHVSVKPALAPSKLRKKNLEKIHLLKHLNLSKGLTFCMDGHEDGEVSRPWGVCVNKNNEIIIADRRNNRIQVFFQDGAYKFKFGTKGTSNGQFGNINVEK